MRKLLILCLYLTASAFAQISGAGQLGCNGTPVTGTAWTSATSNNTAQILGTNVTGAQVLVTIDQTTTLTVGAVTFQGDPGDGTFVTLASWQIVDPTAAPFATISNPYTLQASTNKQFLVLMGGMSRLQLKLTTAITGSGSITPFTTLVCYQLPLAFQNTNTNLNVSATFPSAQAVTQSGGPWTSNVTQFGSSAVVTGTGTGGAGIPRFTVSNDSNILATQSGNWTARTVGNAGGIFDQAPGSAVPANVVMEGLSDGTNAQRALADTNGRQIVKSYPDTTTTSYHASTNVASAASATDIAVLPGNATNKVLVNRITVTCTQTTAGIITLQLIKRSTADTAGTSANITVVPDYSSYAAGVSVPVKYTANPTTGTAIGNVDTALVGCMATGTTSPNDIYIFSPLKPIILNGTAEQLAVNLNAATVSGGSFDVTFDYEETTTP